MDRVSHRASQIRHLHISDKAFKVLRVPAAEEDHAVLNPEVLHLVKPAIKFQSADGKCAEVDIRQHRGCDTRSPVLCHRPLGIDGTYDSVRLIVRRRNSSQRKIIVCLPVNMRT